MLVTDKPVAPIESPSNSQVSTTFPSHKSYSLPPLSLQTTNLKFPKRGVLFTPHPLKPVTIAGLEKNLLQRSLAPTPKKSLSITK